MAPCCLRQIFQEGIIGAGKRSPRADAQYSSPDAGESTKLLSDIQNKTEVRGSSYVLDPLAGWLTLAAVIVIFLVALFPFNFSIQATAFRREGFFLFWLTPVAKGWTGWFLNILFFFPFGIGWAWWTSATNRRLHNWVVTGLAGLFLTLTVEYLQLLVPARDSSWDDVVMNTLGTLLGWLVFRYAGAACLRYVDNALDDLSSALGR